MKLMESVEKQGRCSILKSVEEEKVNGELILKRINSSYYVSVEHTIGEVAELFINDSTMQALGVTDADGKAEGLVVRNELFALIGQKFGRELYLNKNIREVMRLSSTVYYKRGTFSVIDELSSELQSDLNRYYILVDVENRYRGLISTFDLVIFLSGMMTRELKAAKKVHSTIVMDRINISGESFDVAGTTVMAGETGGDFQYIRKTGDNRWFISLCDVSGKGLNAGLISVAVSSMYAVYDFSMGIQDLLVRINSYIHELFGGEIFLTGVFLEFDEVTGELSLYDMGHSMFYVLRDGKAGTPSKQKDNIPLGVRNGIEPVKSSIKLERGDTVVSYTDGLSEQVNLQNESFGDQKVLSLALKYRNRGLDQIKDIIYEEVRAWRFGNAQGDDMSLLMLRFK